MSVDVSSFKARFPEFDLGVDATQDALITAVLAEAEGSVDRSLFQSSTNADTAVKYRAAHLLACSPAGMKLKLVGKDGMSGYEREFQRQIIAVTTGHRVP